MTAPLYQNWTKGTDAETGSPRYSANWATARRGQFKCYSDRVECGDWTIQAADVQEAVLYETRQWFIPVLILGVSTTDRRWQFGFNPWTRVARYLPFAFRRERVRLGYSKFSLLGRAVLALYAAFWLWRLIANR